MIFEFHEAAEGVALVSRGDIGANMRAEDAGNLVLEVGNLGFGPGDLGIGCAGLPLEREDVEDGSFSGRV